MKKSVMFLLLSLVCLSVSAQNGKVKSGVIGGVSEILMNLILIDNTL
jgi:hypothetical protein